MGELMDNLPVLSPSKSQGRNKPKINRKGDLYEPKGYDACQTPPIALHPLLPFLNKDWIIWEPACGEWYLVEGFRKAGFFRDQIIASDILSGQNFFNYQPETWDVLITNPPYSIKYPWLKRCYELGNPFALLLPVETLGAKSAQTLFREYGIQVILMDRRINFKMPNIGFEGSSAKFPSAWFTWGLNLGKQMIFAELPREK